MPAGLAFLNVKSWHPATYENQKRIWIAEKKDEERKKKEKEAAQQLAKEMESIRYEQMARTQGASMTMLATDQERAEQGNTSMNFLYAKPPGMLEAEAALAGPGGDDEAVKEFYRKAAEKKKKNEDFSMHSKITALEKLTGVKRRTDELTIEEQVERFPFLANAPLEGGYAKDVKVTLKPFNKLVRNTRCLRCGEWGHQTGDRECSLKDFNPHDAARQQREDPLTFMQQALPSEKQKIVLKLAALPREMQQGASGGGGGGRACDEVVLEEEDGLLLGGMPSSAFAGGGGAYDDVDEAFLATLSTKEKKLLLKRLKREAGAGGGEEDETRERKKRGRQEKKSKSKKGRKKKDKKKEKKKRHKSSKTKRRNRSSSTSSSSSSSSSSASASGNDKD